MRRPERVARVERRAAAAAAQPARSGVEPPPTAPVRALRLAASSCGADRLGTARRRARCAAARPRPRARGSASASGPRLRLGHHELVERHAPLDRLAHQRADDGVRLAERHPLARRGARRGRWPPRSACRPPPACGSRSNSAVASRPAQRGEAQRESCRARRRAAPCPPGGRGCTPAAGP